MPPVKPTVPSPTTQPTDQLAEMVKRLAALEAENTALKAAKAAGVGRLSLKVSEKGAMSIYGLGRFPLTAYKAQWEAILAKAEDIKAFLNNPANKFSSKADRDAKAVTPGQAAVAAPAAGL